MYSGGTEETSLSVHLGMLTGAEVGTVVKTQLKDAFIGDSNVKYIIARVNLCPYFFVVNKSWVSTAKLLEEKCQTHT